MMTYSKYFVEELKTNAFHIKVDINEILLKIVLYGCYLQQRPLRYRDYLITNPIYLMANLK
jgi:hypothetical protein